MFKIFRNKLGRANVRHSDLKLYSPVNGRHLMLEQVNDTVFSSKSMGDGFAIAPDAKNNTIASPVTGKITMIASTKHALGFETNDGLEVLLHLGIDTVNMNGKPFEISARVGDMVQGGDVLGTMDLAAIQSAGYETTVLVLITNMNAIDAIEVRDVTYSTGEVVGKVMLSE